MVSFASILSYLDLKKLTFSDQLLSSSRRKVVSRFGLGIVLSFIVLSLVLFDFPSKGPFLNPVFQGLNSFSSKSNNSSSILSWPFSSGVASVSNNTSSLTSSNGTSDVVKKSLHPSVLNETLEANVVGSNKSSDFVGSDAKDEVFDSAHLGNVSENYKDGIFIGGEGSVGVDKDGINGTHIHKNTTLKDGNGIGKDVENVRVGDSVVDAKNESVGFKENGEVGSVGNYSLNGDNGDSRNKGSQTPGANKSLYKDCDIYNGRWVRDESKPYYPAGSCPYIDRDFDCHLNGRPDSEYVKWRWQPYDCDIPRLNTTDFLERLRGKKLVFVGDSLNRNMWESLVCVLRHGVKDKKRVYEISGKHEFKKKGFYAFRFEDYNCSVDFVSSPFLVRQSSFKGKNGSFETLRLDLMDGTTSMYHDADVLIFNTGHWWTHEKTSLGEAYYQEGNYVHPRLKVLEAFKRALATWARWVDKNIDRSRTQVIFRGYSVTHFRGGPWNSGGQCQKETEPIFNETYLAKYPSKMKILEYVIQGMKTPVTYLNISRLTDYRKDGHPSIYRPDYQATQQLAGMHPQDCSHWCLPGVPDTWNELLYVSLLKSDL